MMILLGPMVSKTPCGPVALSTYECKFKMREVMVLLSSALAKPQADLSWAPPK